MPEVPKCAQCGAPLPSEGWAGLCPKCLVRVSLEATTREDHAEERPERTAALTAPKGQPEDAPPGEPTLVLVPSDVLLERAGMMIGPR